MFDRLFFFRNPTAMNDTTILGLSCLSLFGGPVAPRIAFGGYDGKKYTDARALVVTFVINNHEDDSKNDRAKAWEKAFIDYLKNFNDPDLEVGLVILVSQWVMRISESCKDRNPLS